jgi:hypothetical protein
MPRRPARRLGAVLLGVALAAAPARPAAADLKMSWDQDLAFEWDRANYQRTLRSLVDSSEVAVTGWLGRQRTRPLEIKVMTRVRYEADFGSGMAAATGAHYRSGVIHVNGGARFDGWFVGILAHEMTHALLDDRGRGGLLPTWLNEGLAERLGLQARGQQDLDSNQRQELETALEQRHLLPLPTRGITSRFSYLQAFAAVLFLERKVGKERLLALVRATQEKGWDRARDAELGWSDKKLEEEFSYWVDHLQ